METDDLALFRSALGGFVLLLLVLAGFSVWGTEPLWLPMKAGGEEFNPRVLNWLHASIPAGSLLGCAASMSKTRRAVWWFSVRAWFVGCLVGFVLFFQMMVFLPFFHPLLICGIGLAFSWCVFCGMLKRPRMKPPRIGRPL